MIPRSLLFPAQSDYLFFVSKNDSTHHFSKTLAEHNRAVRKYQLNK
ncbi:MAG: endolytic transglycosylase MltG [Desulfobacteraceae bacterium]|nr:endolytic transglycosylase MltG [Desulfobacteraceae bacterium]